MDTSKFLAFYNLPDGVGIGIATNAKVGFCVTWWDTDAEQSLPDMFLFPTIEQAQAYVNSQLVKVYPVGESYCNEARYHQEFLND